MGKPSRTTRPGSEAHTTAHEGLSLAALVEGTARRFPDRVALVEGERSRRYAELLSRARRLAAHMQAVVPSGRRVAVYGDNRIEWVEAYLAAHLARIPVVPINGRYRSREVAHIVADADVALVLHDEQVSAGEGVPDLLGELATVSFDHPRYEQLAGGGGVPALDVDRHCSEELVVYTSGTTALPKGTRYTAMNQFASGVLMPMLLSGYDLSDRYLVFTPLAHRGSATFLVCGLVTGATVHLAASYSPAKLVDYARAQEITVLVGVPTALRDLINLRHRDEVDPVECVRHVFLTGEAMPGRFRADAIALFPQARFGSAYGSTECGYVTYLEHEDQLTHPDACGRVVPGVQLRVSDRDGTDLPPGDTGELLVRAGAPGEYTVAAGYLGRDGFADADGWFATGDLGYVDASGYVHIVDRKKNMIVTGGVNVAAAEVEAIVASHPDVEEVAVVGEPDERLGERVVAWVVARPGASITTEDLREHVGSVAAAIKKPRAVHFVERLPRTATGKVMRRELAAGVATSPTDDQELR